MRRLNKTPPAIPSFASGRSIPPGASHGLEYQPGHRVPKAEDLLFPQILMQRCHSGAGSIRFRPNLTYYLQLYSCSEPGRQVCEKLGGHLVKKTRNVHVCGFDGQCLQFVTLKGRLSRCGEKR